MKYALICALLSFSICAAEGVTVTQDGDEVVVTKAGKPTITVDPGN